MGILYRYRNKTTNFHTCILASSKFVLRFHDFEYFYLLRAMKSLFNFAKDCFSHLYLKEFNNLKFIHDLCLELIQFTLSSSVHSFSSLSIAKSLLFEIEIIDRFNLFHQSVIHSHHLKFIIYSVSFGYFIEVIECMRNRCFWMRILQNLEEMNTCWELKKKRILN